SAVISPDRRPESQNATTGSSTATSAHQRFNPYS
ncbi:uncharacterized protein METZ01_LOCUS300637, partial [marine metagenome]